MKKIFLGLLLLTSAGTTLTSCKQESVIPAPAVDSVPLIFPEVTAGKDFYSLTAAKAAAGTSPRPVYEFTINPTNQGDTKLKTVEVYKSYQRNGIIGPRVKVGDYSSFPATISLNSDEALAGLKRLNATANGTSLVPVAPATPGAFNNLLALNDAILFTFEYVLEDGRRIALTPQLKSYTLSDNSVINVIAAGTLTLPPYSATAVFR